MGTHPNGPCVKKDTGISLKSIVLDNPDLLTEDIANKYGDLPFLFKVLSIRTALSIQAHPDKKLAEYLYQNYPEKYKGKIYNSYLINIIYKLCFFINTFIINKYNYKKLK